MNKRERSTRIGIVLGLLFCSIIVFPVSGSDNIQGQNWIQATPHAQFSDRLEHSSVVFDDKLWVIAGENASATSFNDVWFSPDGITWNLATANASFSQRCGQKSVVFKDKMWVIGGAGITLPENP